MKKLLLLLLISVHFAAASSPFAKCSIVTAVANNQGVKDSDCAKCANGAQLYWPCSIDLCQCGTGGGGGGGATQGCSNVPSFGDPAVKTSSTAVALRARMAPARSTGANVDRVHRVFNRSTFEAMFPIANRACGPKHEPYTYDSLVRAIAKFPYFCDESDGTISKDAMCKVELVTLFSHFVQETGENGACGTDTARSGLYWLEEIGCSAGTCTGYTAANSMYPPTPGQTYYGRGPFQLSWNYNYGPFSQVVFGDAKVLLDKPDLVVSSDPNYSWLAFASALWFYMTPQPPKPSMHDVVVGNWQPNAQDKARGLQRGFGATTNIINGGIECNKGSDYGRRLEAYKAYCEYFGIASACEYGEKSCKTMQQFVPSSSVSRFYLKRSGNCACELASYSTEFALSYFPSDAAAYAACVNAIGGTCACLLQNFPSAPTPAPAAGWMPNRVACSCPSMPASATTTKTPIGPYATCARVVAVPGSGETDATCGPCAFGQQTFWPCGAAHFGIKCKCTTGTAPPPTTTIQTTANTMTNAPTTTTTTIQTTTTTTTTTKASPTGPYAACNKVVAVPGNPQSATDGHCAPCANGRQSYWPCEPAHVNVLCKCAQDAVIDNNQNAHRSTNSNSSSVFTISLLVLLMMLVTLG